MRFDHGSSEAYVAEASPALRALLQQGEALEKNKMTAKMILTNCLH